MCAYLVVSMGCNYSPMPMCISCGIIWDVITHTCLMCAILWYHMGCNYSPMPMCISCGIIWDVITHPCLMCAYLVAWDVITLPCPNFNHGLTENWDTSSVTPTEEGVAGKQMGSSLYEINSSNSGLCSASVTAEQYKLSIESPYDRYHLIVLHFFLATINPCITENTWRSDKLMFSIDVASALLHK